MTIDSGIILARARSDGEDCLVSAEEPLAGLQLRCGGALPGVIAVPELRELVRKARRRGVRLSRSICAQDGVDTVTAWVEIEPLVEGCDIRVRSWQSSPVPIESADVLERRRVQIDRHLAEISVRLDHDQRVLAVTSDSAELADLAAAMAEGIGKPWTDFLPPENITHDQPLHWRLLDGVRVQVPESLRSWRVTLVPFGKPGFDPAGFELFLLSDQAPSRLTPTPPSPKSGTRHSLVGQDLAPVLKQPISRIVANAETIRTRLAGPLPDAYSDYAGEIASAGRLLLDLLDDMADLEVVESEGFSTAPDRIDLSEVSRQAAGILGVRAREKGIAIEAPHPSESLRAVAEFRRVLQVLLNLVGNAIRYSPENSRIWIRLEDAGGYARVIVADQGPGLSAEQQVKVFDKFERLGRSGDGGTGLGLYISRRLARAMGGELSIESAPGQGARFILEVPSDRLA